MKSSAKGSLNSSSSPLFLRSSGPVFAAAAALAGTAKPGYAAGDDTLRVALIGCGGRGSGAAANALATRSLGPIKLFAMADLFEDRLQRSLESLKHAGEQTGGSADGWIMGYDAAQVEVPPDRQFLGFDAYRKAMDSLRPGDIVILTTPVAFRWVHFAYAISKRLNVFMEKPICVDGPTTRKMIQLGEDAKQHNLKVAVGLMCRHCEARRALYARIKQGEIGDILLMRSYRLIGPAGFTGPKAPDQNELLYQIQRYLGFMWASGGVFHDFVAHNLDECCWMKDAWPVRAMGLGARTYRGDAVDQNLDSYAIEYTFEDGTKLQLNSRYMPGCREEFASYAHGTRGSAVISTFMHTPAKCRIFKGQRIVRDEMTWAFPQPEPNPYQLEWDHLVAAIRQDQPYNEVKRGAEAAMVVAMGRKAVHTGQEVTFADMLNDSTEFAPEVDKMSLNTPAPVQAGADGKYPGPQPGILKDREF
jgi:predicted dehydrogenase